eukprot:6671540-Heterocapsa_arctica.AAC.1
MAIARMPEDRSKSFKNIQQPLTTFKAIYTCMCTPVGRTEFRLHPVATRVRKFALRPAVVRRYP